MFSVLPISISLIYFLCVLINTCRFISQEREWSHQRVLNYCLFSPAKYCFWTNSILLEMCIWESLDKILYDWIWSCVRFAVRTNLKRFAICWSMQTVVCKAVIAYWSGRFVLHLVSRRYQQAVVKPRHNAYVLKSKFVLFLFCLNLVGIKKKKR